MPVKWDKSHTHRVLKAARDIVDRKSFLKSQEKKMLATLRVGLLCPTVYAPPMEWRALIEDPVTKFI